MADGGGIQPINLGRVHFALHGLDPQASYDALSPDALQYADAVGLVVRQGYASTGTLQRRRRLGYTIAAILIERMERQGIVGPANPYGRRDVLDNVLTREIRSRLADRYAHSPGGFGVGDKPEDDGVGDKDALTAVASNRLKSFVERLERLEDDRAAVLADLKEVYAEAKGEGFDVKILRKVVRLRAQDRAKRDEEQALIDLYLAAIGEAA